MSLSCIHLAVCSVSDSSSWEGHHLKVDKFTQSQDNLPHPVDNKYSLEGHSPSKAAEREKERKYANEIRKPSFRISTSSSIFLNVCESNITLRINDGRRIFREGVFLISTMAENDLEAKEKYVVSQMNILQEWKSSRPNVKLHHCLLCVRNINGQ